MTTEKCYRAIALDAMFRNYEVVGLLPEITATYDYPDRCLGSMSNAEVHRATLVILIASTAHVTSVAEMAGWIA